MFFLGMNFFWFFALFCFTMTIVLFSTHKKNFKILEKNKINNSAEAAAKNLLHRQ